MAFSHHAFCRRAGYCRIDEKHILIEERHERKWRLYQHFRDVRGGWRDLRRAGRNFRRMLGAVSRANLLLRATFRLQRHSLAD